MKLRFVILFLIHCFVLLFFVCCRNSNKKEQLSFVEGIEWPLSTKGDSILSKAGFYHNENYLIVCDANCSFCIGHLFKEINLLKNRKFNKIFVLVPISSEKILNYYLKMNHKNLLDKIQIIENEDLTLDKLEKYNGIIFRVSDSILVSTESCNLDKV